VQAALDTRPVIGDFCVHVQVSRSHAAASLACFGASQVRLPRMLQANCEVQGMSAGSNTPEAAAAGSHCTELAGVLTQR
jgi:hypothetical protein